MNDYYQLGSIEAIMDRLHRDRTPEWSSAGRWAYKAIKLHLAREHPAATASPAPEPERQQDDPQAVGIAIAVLFGVLGTVLAMTAVLLVGMPGLQFQWVLLLAVGSAALGLIAGGIGGRRILRHARRARKRNPPVER